MIVGPAGNTKTWNLPKKLLVNASPFFAAALNGLFAEATSKVINLPEDNTDAFALFIRWLFVGKISGDFINSMDDLTGHELLGTFDGSIDDLLDATITLVYLQSCILGDKLGCSVFQDLATLELIDRHNKNLVCAEAIRVLYEQSGLESKLRRLAIDMFLFDLQNGHLPKDTASLGSAAISAEDFALDCLKTCVEDEFYETILPYQHKGLYMEVLTDVDED